MSRKAIAFTVPMPSAGADAWLNQVREETAHPAGQAKKPTVRFTLDVPADLHRRMKIDCVRQGKRMSDVLRDILEREFPA